jgi:Putative addiction module component
MTTLEDSLSNFNNLPRGARCNWHHEAQRSSTGSRKTHAKLNDHPGHNVAGNRAPMQTLEMQLSADQIVEETSDWPEDAVADLVDRILRAKYGEVDPSVDKAWQDETRRRIADMESGRVQGVPLEETLAKARKITGQ